MTIKDISVFLESLAPISSSESYDNCGLIVGEKSTQVSGVLISLDCTEEIVQEAIDKNCNLIIAHHPIVFKGLKKFNGSNYVERTVIKAIQNNIAIYAIHTNLDNYRFGVNFEIGSRLNLENIQVLQPKKNVLSKLSVFVPTSHLEEVKNALFNSGAGSIGNYSECSFSTNGTGTFTPNESASPFLGEIGTRENAEEIKLEVIVSNHQLNQVIVEMIQAHPYEEVAYDIVALQNQNQYEGSGMVGSLPKPIPTMDFLKKVKEIFQCGTVRYTNPTKKTVHKIAFCGGAGSFLLSNAKRIKADVFITGDFKYHEFFDAENEIVIADIGHYESEQYTSVLLKDVLTKKFTTFAVHLTGVNTNPINYL